MESGGVLETGMNKPETEKRGEINRRYKRMKEIFLIKMLLSYFSPLKTEFSPLKGMFSRFDATYGKCYGVIRNKQTA